VAWTPSDKEISAVLRLPDKDRYKHLVKRAADEMAIWSLRNDDGWVLGSDQHGRETVPVWPHSKYAVLCANGTWLDAVPAKIPLKDWLRAWVPGLVRDGRMVAVFPVPEGGSGLVHPEQLADDLEEELERYG
jgi:hypothetical protein